MKTFLFVLTTGFALFSMFFGAGNLVFPLQLGCRPEFQDMTAVLGFLLTAVFIPLVGFVSIMLYQGNYRDFFSVFGYWGSLAVSLALLAVLGPFGAIPRCAALTYAAFKNILPGISSFLFCSLYFVCVFLCAFRENNIISLLGKWLTPILLAALGIQLAAGFFSGNTVIASSFESYQPFWSGLKEGYYTLDLIAALFFSSFMYPHLARYVQKAGLKSLPRLAIAVSAVAGMLLGCVYLGFFSIASAHQAALQKSPKELLLMHLTQYLLGDWAALIVTILVALACLTTSIALAAILSDFVRQDLLRNSVSYEAVLAAILGISLIVAVQEFTGIEALLGPIVYFLYPFLIALCFINCLRAIKKRKQEAVEAL